MLLVKIMLCGKLHRQKSFKLKHILYETREVSSQEATQGPSWGYLEVNFSETLSIFGDKRPRNGSKNGEMAPRTGTGCPHIGPFVVDQTARDHVLRRQ